MSKIQEQMNLAAIHEFLTNNLMDTKSPMSYEKKFDTFYYVGDKRIFAESTRIGFDITEGSDVNAHMHEINYIDFETVFKASEHRFSYDEENETLTVTGESEKHEAPYKVVINSIYMEF